MKDIEVTMKLSYQQLTNLRGLIAGYILEHKFSPDPDDQALGKSMEEVREQLKIKSD